jgi:hypothetical protein
LEQNITFCPDVDYQLNLYVNTGQQITTGQIGLSSASSLIGGSVGSLAGCVLKTTLNTHSLTFPLNGTSAISVSVGNYTQWQHLAMTFTSFTAENNGTLQIGVTCPGLASPLPGVVGSTISDLLGTNLGLGSVNIGVDSISLDYPYVP